MYVVLTSSGTTVTDEVVLAGYVASYVITRDIFTDIFGCAGLLFCRYLRTRAPHSYFSLPSCLSFMLHLSTNNHGDSK